MLLKRQTLFFAQLQFFMRNNTSILLTIILSTYSSFVSGQTRTVVAAGNWTTASTWQGNNIADVLGEAVSFNNNVGLVTLASPSNLTVGNIAMNNGNTLTIASGATLNLGNSGNSRNLTTGNTAVINITGTLIIWGNLNVGNNLILNVTGTLIIKGNLTLGNGGSLTIDGNVDIDGNFVGGNNTMLDVDGNVDVGGSLTVGNGSTATGSGSVVVSGSCSDGSSSFCDQGPLPVVLLSFSANIQKKEIILSWATASQLNFNYFSVEHSANGIEWGELTQVQGEGTTNELKEYFFEHAFPHPGKNYYRLKMVDLDETFEYSSIAAVEVYETQKEISVYPNPATRADDVLYQLNFAPQENDILAVYDVIGLGMTQLKGDYKGSLGLSANLKPGIYLVKYSTGAEVLTKRLVIK